MSSEEVVELEVGKFYTGTRKFKKVVGKFHDGTRIPGGPYTLTQFVVAGFTAIFLNVTKPVWSPMAGGNPLFEIIVIIGLTIAVGWASGKIPATKRNPFTVALDVGKAVSAPAAGKLQGKVVKIRPPHRAYRREVTRRPAVIPALIAAVPEASPAAIEAPLDTETSIPVIEGPTPKIIVPTAFDRLRQQTQQNS